jgi:hypothetical protein
MEPVILPVTDDFRKKRKLAMIVATVAVIIAVAAFIGTSSYSAKTVNVLSAELVITYENSSAHWLGPPIQFLTANYRTLDGGGSFYYSIQLKDSSSATHYIENISTVTPGFNLMSVNPQTPVELKPGQNLEMNVVIQLPDYNFVGVLSLSVVAS